MNAISVINEKPVTHLEALLPLTHGGMVDARKLHEFLEVKQRFNDWISRRIDQYEFQEGSEYVIDLYDTTGYSKLSSRQLLASEGSGLNSATQKIEYRISIGMAKELGMLENSPKGNMIRKYFIAIENEAYRLQSEKIKLISNDLQSASEKLEHMQEDHERLELHHERVTENLRMGVLNAQREKVKTKDITLAQLSNEQYFKLESKIRNTFEKHGWQAQELNEKRKLIREACFHVPEIKKVLAKPELIHVKIRHAIYGLMATLDKLVRNDPILKDQTELTKGW
jgi:phage anti-repressor protein